METIATLKNNLKEAKEKRANEIKNLINSESVKISIIDDNFISIQAETMGDLKKVLNRIESMRLCAIYPFSVGCTPSLYQITIKNGYYRRELRIEFKAEGVKYWLTIDIKNVSEEFKAKFLREQKRHLYDTETVFVDIPAHFKKFKAIKVQSFSFDFNYKYIEYYGGDIVLLDSAAIDAIINFLKK